jgi:hypothetical protein
MSRPIAHALSSSSGSGSGSGSGAYHTHPLALAHGHSHAHTHLQDEEDSLDVLPTRQGRKLCVRHKQMANQDVNQKLQRVSQREVREGGGVGLERTEDGSCLF